jgi:hypothetical protein
MFTSFLWLKFELHIKLQITVEKKNCHKKLIKLYVTYNKKKLLKKRNLI